jgi:phosphatidylinositol glycan class O
MLQEVVNTIDRLKEKGEKILVVVMGDHGMTHDGNHGGSTSLEVEAVLFFYSTCPLLLNDTMTVNRSSDIPYNTVSQIDIVPTLSLLLGIPIPFGNLGILIPELFLHMNHTLLFDESRIMSTFSLLTAHQKANFLSLFHQMNTGLSLNLWQILNYLIIYSNKTQQFSLEKLEELRVHLEQIENILMTTSNKSNTKLDDDSLLRVHFTLFREYRSFYESLIEMCRRLWITFDIHTMLFGISILTLSVLCLICYLLDGATTFNALTTFSIHFFIVVLTGLLHKMVCSYLHTPLSLYQWYPYYLGFGALCTLTINLWLSSTKSFVFVISFIKYGIPYYKSITTTKSGKILIQGMSAILFLLLRTSGLFSNSYIEAEYSLIFFLIVSQLVLILILHYGHKGLDLWKYILLLLVLRLARGLTRSNKLENYEVQQHYFLFFLRFVIEVLLPLYLINLIDNDNDITKNHSIQSYLKKLAKWSITVLIVTYWLCLKLGLV